MIREASQASVFRNIQTPEWPTDREEPHPGQGRAQGHRERDGAERISAPHVSVFVDVDASRTMEYVKRLKASPDYAGVRVSPLLIMAKAMIWAVRRNPTVNAQWTDDEIIVKHYVNLGVAAATPRGLIVPNVKEAQAMTHGRARGGARAAHAHGPRGQDAARRDAGRHDHDHEHRRVRHGHRHARSSTPARSRIVALGTIKQKPWVVDGEVRPRFVTTIGASFDHRVVDGDVASRFLADVASIIEEPALLLE